MNNRRATDKNLRTYEVTIRFVLRARSKQAAQDSIDTLIEQSFEDTERWCDTDVTDVDYNSHDAVEI